MRMDELGLEVKFAGGAPVLTETEDIVYCPDGGPAGPGRTPPAAAPGAGALQVDGRMVDAPHLKQARRIATRYDKTADSYIGFVSLASALLWLPFVHVA